MACKVVARKHTHGVGGRHCTHASQARTLTSRDLARPTTRSRDPFPTHPHTVTLTYSVDTAEIARDRVLNSPRGRCTVSTVQRSFIRSQGGWVGAKAGTVTTVPLASSRRALGPRGARRAAAALRAREIALRPERSAPPPEATSGSARAQNRVSRRAAGRLPLSLSPPLSRSPHDLGPSSHGPRVTALLEGPLLSRVPARRISTREIGGEVSWYGM